MALRFQKFDEVAQEVKEQSRRGERIVVVILFVTAALFGLVSWIRGESIVSWEKTFAALAGLFFVWFVFSTLASLNIEFTIRTKEIDGKVSAIEEAQRQSKESHAELLERLSAIEDKLDVKKRELESGI